MTNREKLIAMTDEQLANFIVFGDIDGKIGETGEETGDAVDVVEVSVGEENCLGVPAFVFQRCDYAIGFLSGIDDKRFAFVFDD